MAVYSCGNTEAQMSAIARAKEAIGRGEVICIPTDTVYGIGVDPFNRQAIDSLLAAKSRTRAMPPPVLVPDIATAWELTTDISPVAQQLLEHFWPGALTCIFPARDTLGWDLGETKGTVALRMPKHKFTLDLLAQTGPLAVTSANITGKPPAMSVEAAYEQLGENVSVYLDAGITKNDVPSTILQFSADSPDSATLIRAGALSVTDICQRVDLEIS